MKIKSIKLLLLAVSLSSLIISCSTGSSASGSNICDQLAHLNIHPFTPVTKGQPINLVADNLDGAFYHWTGPNDFEAYGDNIQVTSDAYYNHRGTYYVTISNDGCPDRVQSVDVSVLFPQGTPTCTLTNNSAQFSGSVSLASQTFGFMTWGSASTGDNYEIVANGTNGDMTMYMSPYWKTHDLEDGIYYTTTNLSPDLGDYDKIYISDVNGSIFWQCEANKPVYVSHVSGKRRISFCGIIFSGSLGGPSYQTTINAQLTQP